MSDFNLGVATVGTQVDLDGLKEGFDEAAQVAEDSTEKLADSTKESTFSFTEFKSAVDLATQALGYAKQAYDQTVGFTMAYAEQVRTLSRDIGVSTEEASRLIQAADDVGLSYETLRMAAKKLSDDGLQPNLHNLKMLADQYNALESPVERMQFLIDKFGAKAGPEMGRLLEQGSKGLQALAEAADATGLVMGGDAVQAARDYEIALDGLTDSVDGLKVKLGNEVIPLLADFANKINEDAENYSRFERAFNAGVITLQEFTLATRLSRSVQQEHGEEIAAITEKVNAYNASTQAENQSLADLAFWSDEAKRAKQALNQITQEGNTVTELAADVYATAAQAINDMNIGDATRLALQTEIKLATGDLTKEEVERSKAISALTKQLAEGNITQQQYLDALARLASGADTASQAVSRLKDAINNLPAHKRVNVDVNATYGPAAGEAGLEPGSSNVTPGAEGPRPTAGPFARGGSFIVPGFGGTDSQFVSFYATPGEPVVVGNPAGQGMNVTQHIYNQVDYELALSDLADRINGRR